MANNRGTDLKKISAQFLPLFGLCAATIFSSPSTHAQPDFAPRRPEAPARPEPNAPRRAHWVIVLATFRGEEQRPLAGDALALALKRGVADAYLEPRGPAVMLATGRFDSPSQREAQAELARIRAIEVDGVRPFAYAVLAPPDQETAMGSKPQYNLLRARETAGDDVRFTLQVVAYGPADLNNPKPGEREQARADAEQAAAILRKEGELAFYYHGPNFSMVTIGAWTDEAIGKLDDPGDDDPTLLAARKNFPYNLYNGQGVRVGKPGQKDAPLQRSRLVRIPTE
jgi:hypothetical protein